ncbi:MAG: ACT domain-containing protein [Propionibacteriales bacterium]|nr:ACT domain-containing protein [Propionibacteriales bacterium]
MAFLLRVELPDVPGSLGALATALGAAGADIEAIEVIERRQDGRVVDDVLFDLPSSVMPDALVTACHQLDGVKVHWISRYNAGANLSMDLEAVEAFSEDPAKAIERFVDVIPATFRADWAMALTSVDGVPTVLYQTPTAPKLVNGIDKWLGIRQAKRLPDIAEWESTVLAAAPVTSKRIAIVFGRHGGPEILNSEIARLGHMASLAGSVSNSV